MLKKTTVYLDAEDISLLKKKATIQNVTVAEAIRLSIKESCQPKTKEEKRVWDSLDSIWAKTAAISADKIEASVDKAVQEVRSGKRSRRRT